MKEKTKILVTGGTGYIGSHTAVELINAGYDVVIIDNLSNSNREVLDGIEAIRILVQREGSFEELDRVLQIDLKRGFDAISTLDEAGQITRCYLRPEEKDWNGYAEFVMFSYGTRETVLLDIYGTFDVHSISRLTAIRPN